jgi:hypothetical protein
MYIVSKRLIIISSVINHVRGVVDLDMGLCSIP